jgi:hypothetical protein
MTLGCAGGAAPVLVAPLEGEEFDTTGVDLDWDAVGDAVSYALQVSAAADFSTLILDTQLLVSAHTVSGLADSTTYYWRVNSTNGCKTGDWSQRSFRVELCPVELTGDVNVNGVRTSADVIYMVNYVFKGGPPPLPVAGAGDVNCDGSVTSADIIYLVNHVFKSGPAPCDVCSIL